MPLHAIKTKVKVISTAIERITNYKGETFEAHKYTITSGDAALGETVYISLSLRSPLSIAAGDELSLVLNKIE